MIRPAALACLALLACAAPAQADDYSKACFLSDKAMARFLGGGDVTVGESDEQTKDGEHACAYTGEDGRTIIITLFTQAYVDAFDASPGRHETFGTIRAFFDGYKSPNAGRNETVETIGEDSIYWIPPESGRPQRNGFWQSKALRFFKNEQFINISFGSNSGWELDKATHVELGRLVAKKL